jgi:hypothetical protein
MRNALMMMNKQINLSKQLPFKIYLFHLKKLKTNQQIKKRQLHQLPPEKKRLTTNKENKWGIGKAGKQQDPPTKTTRNS